MSGQENEYHYQIPHLILSQKMYNVLYFQLQLRPVEKQEAKLANLFAKI